MRIDFFYGTSTKSFIVRIFYLVPDCIPQEETETSFCFLLALSVNTKGYFYKVFKACHYN